MKKLLIMLWAMLCLPLAVVFFYIIEALELAQVFSGWIEEKLRE